MAPEKEEARERERGGEWHGLRGERTDILSLDADGDEEEEAWARRKSAEDEDAVSELGVRRHLALAVGDVLVDEHVEPELDL